MLVRRYTARFQNNHRRHHSYRANVSMSLHYCLESWNKWCCLDQFWTSLVFRYTWVKSNPSLCVFLSYTDSESTLILHSPSYASSMQRSDEHAASWIHDIIMHDVVVLVWLGESTIVYNYQRTTASEEFLSMTTIRPGVTISIMY